MAAQEPIVNCCYQFSVGFGVLVGFGNIKKIPPGLSAVDTTANRYPNKYKPQCYYFTACKV